MNPSTSISTRKDITLVTLQGSPTNIRSIAQIFHAIGAAGINVDMISMAPSQGSFTGLSFTLSDEDLGAFLKVSAQIKEDPAVDIVISSGNCKVSVHDRKMLDTPGIASSVFGAIAKTEADIGLITTSEVDISILVSAADYDEIYTALLTLQDT